MSLEAECAVWQGEGAEEDDSQQEGDLIGVSASLDAPSNGKVVAGQSSEKKTQTDRNRDKRRRDAEEEQNAKQRLKKQRRDLDMLSDFNQEITHQEVLQQAKALRKAVTKAEKALIEPPKLGKHKFQPANIQVPLKHSDNRGKDRISDSHLLISPSRSLINILLRKRSSLLKTVQAARICCPSLPRLLSPAGSPQ